MNAGGLAQLLWLSRSDNDGVRQDALEALKLAGHKSREVEDKGTDQILLA